MTRLGTSLVLAFLTGCVGHVSSGSGGDQSGPQSQATPDECKPGDSASCVQVNGNVGAKSCEVGSDGYVWGACIEATCRGATLACTTLDGHAGFAQCADGQSNSACGLAGECQPGAVQTAPCNDCICQPESDCTLVNGAWQWQAIPCNTPLVLAFDGAPVAFTRAAGEFDLVGGEASVATRWVSAQTPWLAIDLDGNGRIDDGRELFGSMTHVAGGRAPNGFAALAALDDDHDGRITPRDAAFDRLVLWRDADQDRRSQPGELQSARDAGLAEIRLSYEVQPRCEDGDCEVERATFLFRDAAGRERQGAVVDVHLATR